MPWVESASGSFRARHDEADARDARRVLQSLELTRARARASCSRARVDELTVVLHRSVASLTLTNPPLPLAWLLTAPAARRYVAGWAGRQRAPRALARRCCGRGPRTSPARARCSR